VLYTTDYAALDADLLKGKRLLSILRDGMLWPHGEDQPYDVWMQPHQEAAIESFVTSGGFVPGFAQCGVGLSMEGWLPAHAGRLLPGASASSII